MAERTVAERLVSFHSEASVYAEQASWLLARLDEQFGSSPDAVPLNLLRDLHSRFESLVLDVDCRAATVVDGDAGGARGAVVDLLQA